MWMSQAADTQEEKENNEEPSQKDKPLQSVYHWKIEKVDDIDIDEVPWVTRKAGVKHSKMELMEAEERSLSTNAIGARIYIRHDCRCRLCKDAPEMVMATGLEINKCAFGLQFPQLKWETYLKSWHRLKELRSNGRIESDT